MDKLTDNFLNELFKGIISNEKILRIAKHHLEFHYIPKELPNYKLIYQAILNATVKPSLGYLSQALSFNQEAQEVLAKIRDTDVPDFDSIIKSLERYIKQQQFEKLYNDVYTSYSDGDSDGAIQKMVEESQKIHTLSLFSGSGKFFRVFKDFEEGVEKDIQNAINSEDKPLRMPFSIDCLDDQTLGGMLPKTSALILARSGEGKSTIARYIAFFAALKGYRVLHVQLEGSENEVRHGYNQLLSGVSSYLVERGEYSDSVLRKVLKLKEEYTKKTTDIHIYASEKFDSFSCVDLDSLLLEYEKENGCFPDLLVMDSLNLINTGVNKRLDSDPAYLKAKLKKSAELITNLSGLRDMRSIITMQAKDIPMDKWNDPKFGIDRSYTEGDRTLIQPFSYVFSHNRTMEEIKNETARIFIDKLRKHKVVTPMNHICTNYDKGKYYNRKRTIDKFYKSSEL